MSYGREMHGFPPLVELERFVGDGIAQVLLDPHSVQFLLESSQRIVVELRLEHAEPDGTIWTYDCGPPYRPLVLQGPLYKRIVAVEADQLQLVLKMEDGASLTIFAEIGPYESGHFLGPDGDVRVF